MYKDENYSKKNKNTLRGDCTHGVFQWNRKLRNHHADDKKRDDVQYLDHRIDRRPCGVLIRIADGVASHSGFMRVASFTAKVSLFDILLRVIPCASAGRHGDGDEESGDDASDEETAQRLRTEK